MGRPLRLASLAAVVAAAGAAWFFLAPLELGGSTSYAVVYGTSMEPHLHRGDLVVLRRQPDYRRGEIVGYRSRVLHRNVLHRIVGVEHGRFEFKGDNNDFADPERPAQSRLFGREWIVLPHAGAALQSLRSPRYASAAAAVAVLLLAAPGSAGAVRRRRRKSGRAPRRPRVPAVPASAAAALGAAGAAAAVLGLALGVVAHRQPAERVVTEPGLYVQRGAFSWSARTPVGAVYEAPRLAPTEPVFLRLVHRLDVHFDYRVRSRFPAELTGAGSLAVILSDGNGWRRTLELTPDRPLRGGRLRLAGTLDLRRLTGTIRRFEAQTGVSNPSYRLTLAPRVRLRGTAGGRPVATTFAPPLALDLDRLRLRLAESPTAGANTLVRTAAAANRRVEPGELHLLGQSVSVALARTAALLTLVAGLAALVAGGALTLLRGRGDAVAAIERRYGDLIVHVGGRERAAGERRVASIDELARVAERHDRLILHEERGGRHSFLVEDAGVVFRYDLGPAAADATAELAIDEAHRERSTRLHAADR